MGLTRGAGVLVLAALLVAVPLAGCVGSPGSAGDSGSRATNDTDEPETDRSGTNSSSSDDGSGDDSSRGDSNQTEPSSGENETRHNTTSFSTVVNASVSFPGIEGNPAEAQWTPYDDPPRDNTAILIEVEWSTPTKGTPLGDLVLQYEAPDSGLTNQSDAESGVLRVWIEPSQYRTGDLILKARPAGGDGGSALVDVWVRAEVTFHATAFFGGPPDKSFSAVGG